jgi:hypothetical protein
MKKILLKCLIAFPIFYGHAQSNLSQETSNLEVLIAKTNSIGHQSRSINEFFTSEEIAILRAYHQNQNSLQLNLGNPLFSIDGINGLTTGIGGEQSAFLSLVGFDLDNPSVLTPIGTGSGGSDFEGAGAISNSNPEVGYAVDITGKFYRIDTTTGVYTLLGNVGVGDINGMEFNPVDGVLYAVTSTKLYTINPTAVTATQIGNLNTTGIAIAMAINGNGTAFVVDIMDDSLYSVNLSTGNSTLIGSIGFDANYGQGMGWDAETNTIYMAAFNNSSFAPELRAVNTSTGETTFLGTLNPSTLSQVSWVSFISESAPVTDCNVNYEGSLEEGLGSDESYIHANDFEVAANTAFHIEKYQFRVFNNISAGKIMFYTDLNGAPNEMVYETDYIAPSSQDFVMVWEDWLNVYDVVFDFPTPVILNGGAETTKYWVAFAYQYGNEMDVNFFETSDEITNSVTYLSIDGGNIWDPNSSGLDEAFKLIGECATLALPEFTQFEFAYYPNPVKDILNINSQKEIKLVQAFNLAGQEVLKTSKVSNGQVKMNNLAQGTYLFRVMLDGGQIETFKIIKK